jgi:serine/threonine protein kinase
VELCEGTLQNYILGELKSIPKNSLDDRNILGQVTLGLAYIHSKEIIHKDLKPSNILLWRSSVIKTLVLVKLADFDFAKQSKTSRGDFSATFRPGTEGYMAPELLKGMSQNKGQQMRKVLATVHSDAYSLGITIGFTVLKGQHPFGNQQMIRGRVMESGAEPVLLGNLDWDVTDLILRLTREDPEERPNISLLIYHPYFVLANEKSRAHFADKIDDYFNLFQSPYEARMTYVNEVKIQEWMQIITSQTERETNLEVKKWLEQVNLVYNFHLST